MLIWAEQLCGWVWYRLELKWPLGFHPVADTALFFCSAGLGELLFTHRLSISHLTAIWGSGWLVGIPHLTEATTQAFARTARTPYDLHLGGLGVRRTQPHSGHQPASDKQLIGETVEEDFQLTLPRAH